ncbi:MAG: LapA family protein [Acidimicrobiales bacterium]
MSDNGHNLADEDPAKSADAFDDGDDDPGIEDNPSIVVPSNDTQRVEGGTRVERLETQAKLGRTRISATWVGFMVAIVVLVLLLVFIVQNNHAVQVRYLGASGEIPLGVALLVAALGGALLVAIVGIARLTQLRVNRRRGKQLNARRKD